MGARYVLNPLHVRRRNTYWIQIGPRKAVSWEGTEVLDRLRLWISPGKTATEDTIRKWLSASDPASTPAQLHRTFRALVRSKVLVGASEARTLPEHVLRPTLDLADAVLERIRLQSYRDRDFVLDSATVHWPPSIFNPLGTDRRVFFSYLLIVATRLGLDYTMNYEDAKHLRITFRSKSAARTFSSRLGYFPQEDERGELLVENKSFANYLCQIGGVRVPTQWRCSSLAIAYKFADRYGFPIVVKPQRGDSGTDVYANLSTNAMLRELVPPLVRKWKYRGGLVVEEYVPGNRYRLVILGSEIVESRAALPPIILGDGKRSIRDLIRVENRRRKREYTHSKGEAGIHIDTRMRRQLRFQSYRLDTVLPRGKEIQLHYTLNRATGARSEAIPAHRIHPAVKRMAITAVKLFGLHLAGVDYIAPNVTQSPQMSGGKICEVQARPGIFPSDLDYEAFVEKVLRHAMSQEPEVASARLVARRRRK